jgi:hypothetical protein
VTKTKTTPDLRQAGNTAKREATKTQAELLDRLRRLRADDPVAFEAFMVVISRMVDK